MGFRLHLSPRLRQQMRASEVPVNRPQTGRAYFNEWENGVTIPRNWDPGSYKLGDVRLGHEGLGEILAQILPWHEWRHASLPYAFPGLEPFSRQWSPTLADAGSKGVPPRLWGTWLHDMDPAEIDADIEGIYQTALDQSLAQRMPLLGDESFQRQLALTQVLLGRTRLADLMTHAPESYPGTILRPDPVQGTLADWR